MAEIKQKQSSIDIRAQLGSCAKNFTCRDDVQKCVSSVELGKTSLNCKNCFKELSTCIIDKCSGPCFKENADHNQCEKCAKDVKCSLDECNSPNYFLHKRKVPGMPVRIFSWLLTSVLCVISVITM